jgi:hypothetical protein
MYSPIRPAGFFFLAVCTLGATASVAHSQRDFGAMQLLLTAADGDKDGLVDGTEWSAFIDALPVTDKGTITRGDLLARLLGASLDLDGDGTRNLDEVRDALQALDQSQRAALSFGQALARDVLATAGDLDRDGDFTDAEKAAFVDSLAEGVLDDRGFAAVIEVAAAVPPPDDNRNAMTPGVFLVTLEGALDQNRNGRIGTDDLHAIHMLNDVDGDGSISMDEVRATSRGRSRGMGPNWVEEGDGIDWANREPAMPWQRNLEDAQALSAATGKPLLICVNMDGETASDTIAARHYRDPEFVALAEGFIPLIVSPDKHQARDYADDGSRLVDPRLGRVVDREHIDLEPLVYEAYFNGRRVAPRHVGVSHQGEVLFDLYLLNDLSIIERTLAEHGVAGPLPAASTEEERLGSPNAAHRAQLEEAFTEGTVQDRMRLIASALSTTRLVQHPELLRLGLFGSERDVRLEAAWAAVRCPHLVPLDLWPGVQRVAATDANAQIAFVATLKREAERTENAALQRMAAVAGLRLNAERLATWWFSMLIFPSGPAPVHGPGQLDVMYRRLDQLDQQPELSAQDHLIRAGLAHALAFARLRAGQDPTGLFEECRRSAREALGGRRDAGAAAGWLAIASYQLSDFEAAGDAATRALPALQDQAGSEFTANVLDVLANSRARGIYAQLEADAALDAEHVRDAWWAYRLLLDHPLGTAVQAKAGLSFFGALGMNSAQGEAVRLAAVRFPADSELHQWLRFVVLRDQGAAALPVAYDELTAVPTATWRWFQALGEFSSAEWALQQADEVTAERSYRASIERFDQVAIEEAGFADSALHYVALAHGALSRSAWSRGDNRVAVDELLLAIQARPSSWAVDDGLGRASSRFSKVLLSNLGFSTDDADAALLEELRSALEAAGLN